MIKTVLLIGITVCAVSACSSAPQPDSEAESGQLNGGAYMKYIVAPSSEQDVILESENLRLVFAPGMVYRLTDKSTGETSAGRVLFYSEIAKTHTSQRERAKVFLFESAISAETPEQFFQGKNIEQDADIVLTPVECTEETVTYIYEKPVLAENTDRRIQFAVIRE